MVDVTREIYWNIEYGYIIYFLCIPLLAAIAYGIYKRYRLWRLGQPETRLDNLVYRLGFAPSRKSARQLVRHRHISVDGRIVNVPSYGVKPSQVIRVKDKSKNLDLVHAALKEVGRGDEIPWLRLNKAALEGELLEVPKRTDIPVTFNEQLVVELYSK